MESGKFGIVLKFTGQIKLDKANFSLDNSSYLTSFSILHSSISFIFGTLLYLEGFSPVIPAFLLH
jgi:hypothetical protein